MIPTGCYNIPAYPALRPTQSSVEVQGPLPLRRQEGSWESGHHWPLHPPLLHLKELRVQGYIIFALHRYTVLFSSLSELYSISACAAHHFCSPQIHSSLLLPSPHLGPRHSMELVFWKLIFQEVDTLIGIDLTFWELPIALGQYLTLP